jgi:filamentous hemagglutinin
MQQTPQAQALVAEIRAANPSLPQLTIEQFAREYLESGTALPQMGVAASGTMLLKAVPKGDVVSQYTGFWMSPLQAQAIATMKPDQIGQLLGLPAAQAANIIKNGIDFYAIAPKVGTFPKVFISNVAPTSQAGVVMPGGAQQVIVPNRGLWTAPAVMDPFSLRPTERTDA